MNAPPEANTEYSRGSGASRADARASQTDSRASRTGSRAAAAVALGALLGALLVVISQFTTLYQVQSATGSMAIKTVGTGANHAWAPIPLALVAVCLAFAAWRYGNRAALAGLVVLGIATLLIALLGDLPNARSGGLIGSSAGGYVQATATPAAGLFMETLGAVLLMIAGGLGILMAAGPAPERGTPHAPPNQSASDAPQPGAPQPPAEPTPPQDPLTLRRPEGRRWSAS